MVCGLSNNLGKRIDHGKKECGAFEFFSGSLPTYE